MSELSHKLFADAKAVDITRTENEADTSSVYEAIVDVYRSSRRRRGD